MIKFLVDENVPPAIGQFLRDKGFEVEEARAVLPPGTQDDTLMALARQEGRILVTFDKHFSNLLVYPPGSHDGIIRIRIHPPLISEFAREGALILALSRLEQYRAEAEYYERKYGMTFKEFESAVHRHKGVEEFEKEEDVEDWGFALKAMEWWEQKTKELQNA